MRILITNDDGILAEGIEVLERVARQFTDDVWVVAPQFDQSGVAHSLSLHDPLRLHQVSDKKFSIRGTPTDCVIMAVDKVMDKKPNLILSGINNGQNVADDITYSGTVAAAIEGTLLGVKSIAVSQEMSAPNKAPRFLLVEQILPGLIKKLVEISVPSGTFFNVNFPNRTLDQIGRTELTIQGKKNWDGLFVDERHDNRGNPYFWLAFRKSDTELDENSDVKALQQGNISVTPLQVDMTDYATFHELSETLKLN